MQYKRKAISPGELYVLLDREFRVRKPRECSNCYLLLPFRVDREDGEANWELVPPPECVNGCAHVIEELVEEYSQQYDLGSDRES